RSATPEACQALVDALGSDLRELASAVSQLVADVEGTIDEAVVGRYYTGRAEASSFTVADRAVEGRTAEALEALRWSLSTGVAPVLDRKSTRLNSSHVKISYAVFCLKKKKRKER